MLTDVRTLPPRPNLEQYKKQAKDLARAYHSGDAEAARRIATYHPRRQDTPPAGFSLADAQLVIAREHGFESWPKFARHVQALTRHGSAVSKFELAADAIVAGDTVTLERLLRESPELIRARSTRVHRGTLLHYIGANGVEYYRQKTPANSVEVLKILLQAGAEVNAVADMYSNDTTLALVATSAHPARAGVQLVLLETLLDAGADVDPGHSVITACLANGRAEAAAFLAGRGAGLDLEGAAGLGRLDLVRTYFGEGGDLKATGTKQQMERGFLWACEYGRNSVVDFLLAIGVDLLAQAGTGQTGLHWAVIGGQADTVRLLLGRGASLEARNAYGGTALGQAVWSAINGDAATDYVPIITTLIEAGAKVEEAGCPTGHARVDDLLRHREAKS